MQARLFHPIVQIFGLMHSSCWAVLGCVVVIVRHCFQCVSWYLASVAQLCFLPIIFVGFSQHGGL